MAIFDGRIFMDGDDAAVMLPDEIAFPPDTRVTIERRGDVLTIRPATDLSGETAEQPA